MAACPKSPLLPKWDKNLQNTRVFPLYSNNKIVFSSQYGASDFERDEALFADSLTDILDMHNDLRAESEGEINYHGKTFII